MKSQPQDPEFRNIPESFTHIIMLITVMHWTFTSNVDLDKAMFC